MPNLNPLQLTSEELQELENVIAYGENPEAVKRAMALRLLSQGQHPAAIGAMMMVAENTVYRWRRCWQEEGMNGLQSRPRSGRPRKSNAEYRGLLEETLETDPAHYGYSFTVWTSDRLRQHLEQRTGISLSRGRFAILMDEMGYVYRRPKRDLTTQQNQDAKAQAAQLLDELKKGRNTPIVSFSLWTRQP
jgi:transposase